MSEKKILWGARSGTRHYTCHNERGATVEVGFEEGQFSPGQLLQIALGACNTLSCDSRLESELGENFDATFGVDSTYDKASNRYTDFHVEIVTDLSNATDKDDLIIRAKKAIDRACTIGHTLENGTTNSVEIVEE